MTANICFIGGGNMARSLIGGLIANGHPAEAIRAADPNETTRQGLERDFSIATESDNAAAIEGCDAIVLAVKPQMMGEVVQPLAEPLTRSGALLISIAAGLPVAALDRWLGAPSPIVRCMPNTPALLQVGATALYANKQVSSQQAELAEQILGAAGLTLWVDEEAQLDAVTAVSGSGPAYFFAFIEAMQASAVKLGLSPEQAEQLTRQTALGAARMVCDSGDDAATLRKKVTSKGGTTAAALAAFEAADLNGTVEVAMTAARDRASELAEQLKGE
ncbi:MAG: pyrroline-5-carboxylate reductase [Pseudomonadota bacterium]